MTAQETNVTTAAESTLTALLSAGATTINVADTSSFPAVPFYATIDPGSDSKREVVLVDSGKTSTTFTLSSATKRGLDGTSDVAHDSGAVIAVVPVAALWTDINDRVDAVAASAVSDHGALSGLADDDHTQYALADGTRGDFEPTGTAAAEVAAHEAEADPHPQYLTEADGNGAYVPLDTSKFAEPLYVVRSGKDSEGIFTVVQWKRSSDDTLAIESTLSGGTSPEYTTRTVHEYAADGTTVTRTTTYTLTYDVDGDLTAEAVA